MKDFRVPWIDTLVKHFTDVLFSRRRFNVYVRKSRQRVDVFIRKGRKWCDVFVRKGRKWFDFFVRKGRKRIDVFEQIFKVKTPTGVLIGVHRLKIVVVIVVVPVVVVIIVVVVDGVDDVGHRVDGDEQEGEQ